MTDTTQQPANTQETPLAPVLFDKGYGALNAAYTQAIVQLVENLPKYSFERVFVTVKMGAVGSIYDIAKVMGAANSGNFYNVGKEVSSAIGGIVFGAAGGAVGMGWLSPLSAGIGATFGSEFGEALWTRYLAPAIGVGTDGYPVPSGFSVEFKQLYGTGGTAVGLSIITKADSGLLSETRLDNGGLTVSQKTYTTSGPYTVLIDESSPAFSATTGTIGSVFSVDGQGNITAIHSENGYVTTDKYNINGSVNSSSIGPNGTLTLEAGPGQILLNAEAVITDPDTGLPATVDLTDSSSSAVPDSGISTLLNGIATYGGTLIDTLSIIKAIQSGDPLPIAVSGLRLANDISNLAGLTNYNLSGASNVASSILSVLSLENALQRGDTMAAVTAGAQALSFGAQAYSSFAFEQALSGNTAFIDAAWESKAFSESIGKELPYLNLVNSIAHGDAIGTAVAVTDMVLMDAAVYTVPYIGWAYAVYSIVSSLFGDEDPPPEPWGSASAGWSGFSAVANAAGEHGGYEAAQGTMNQFIAQLNSLAAYEQSVNPNSAVGVVANRLPSLSYRNYTGFQLTDIDPLTGVQRNPEIKYDLTGRPYNAPAGSEQASQSLSERFIRVALARGAVAPMWEVQTAAIQTQYGDPQAGLTEEERAGRNGLLAPSPQPSPASGGGSQVFRAVALDLNGDGVQTTGSNKTVAFDVDDSGYLKNTAWLNNNDGFLFLDRNLNGSIDSGRELFSNSIVDLSARGLAGMRWIDANYDGKLTSADPVWNELKIWRDADGDGQADAGETQTLSALGITALDYAMGRFEQNGQLKEMSSPDLAADIQGTRTHVVPEGIVVETTSGHTSLLVTRIDDETVIEANRDGVEAANEPLYFCERIAA